MKTLLLFRHSDAENNSLDKRDHDRILSSKGKEDSILIKHWLQKSELTVNKVFVSSANRTKATAESIFCDHRELIIIKPELYLCSKKELINFLHEVDDNLEIIAIIGHEPSISESLNELVGSYRPDLKDVMKGEYPTSGLSVIIFNTSSWKKIFPRDGTLDAFKSPEMIKN